MKILKTTLLTCALMTLVGCSTYPSKFKCGDAKGLGCTMLSEVDRQITNGAIEEAYKDNKTTCRGRKCSSSDQDKNLPKLKRDHSIKVLTSEIKSDDDVTHEYADGEYLYFRD